MARGMRRVCCPGPSASGRLWPVARLVARRAQSIDERREAQRATGPQLWLPLLRVR